MQDTPEMVALRKELDGAYEALADAGKVAREQRQRSTEHLARVEADRRRMADVLVDLLKMDLPDQARDAIMEVIDRE
jgi:hypothetical protein